MNLITLGSNDPDVLVLQELLGIPETGTFDQVTFDALEAYQTAHGLGVDGAAGQQTWESILPKCIDVSDFTNNTPIRTWTAFDVLIIKTNEATAINPQLGYWTAQAKANGKKLAFYVYTDNRYTPQQHADTLTNCNIDWTDANNLAVFVDYEELQQPMNHADATAYITQLCTAVKQATGRSPKIYTFYDFWVNTIGDPDLSQYGLWDAAVQAQNPAPYGGWTRPLFWQFAQNGSDTNPYGGGDKDWSMFQGGYKALNALANS